MKAITVDPALKTIALRDVPEPAASLEPGHVRVRIPMAALGTNGVFVFTGVPGRKGLIPVDTDVLMRGLVLKNQVVFGTVNAGRSCFESAVRDLGLFASAWPDAVRSLITSQRRAEDYREPLLGHAQGIKNVLSFA